MYEFNPGALDALGKGGTDGRDSREIRRTSSGLILRRIRISHRNALGQVVTTRINAAQERKPGPTREINLNGRWMNAGHGEFPVIHAMVQFKLRNFMRNIVFSKLENERSAFEYGKEMRSETNI